ncbi:hypothetical protein ACFL1X_02380 [Candidatus Hydrogenedentota bacterium]
MSKEEELSSAKMREISKHVGAFVGAGVVVVKAVSVVGEKGARAIAGLLSGRPKQPAEATVNATPEPKPFVEQLAIEPSEEEKRDAGPVVEAGPDSSAETQMEAPESDAPKATKADRKPRRKRTPRKDNKLPTSKGRPKKKQAVRKRKKTSTTTRKRKKKTDSQGE